MKVLIIFFIALFLYVIFFLIGKLLVEKGETFLMKDLQDTLDELEGRNKKSGQC